MLQQQQRPRQASPLSMQSNDSSFLTRYGNPDAGESPYDASLARVPANSPPLSQGQSTAPISEAQSRATSNRSPGRSHASSASSVTGSNGPMYSPVMSDSGMPFSTRNEDALIEHYHVIRRYLAPQLDRDAAAKSSKARDKLLRLSPTQFHELSTDVYDELLRREDERQRRSPDIPPYLLPTKAFHPKRNQARQKLSTLPGERFRQLATDVYYELERRVPRLQGGPDRSASPAFSTASGGRGPPRGPPPPGMRGPPPPGYQTYRGPPSGGRPPQFPARSSSNEYGKPVPKTFQSNTIVPNVATMIEGDDTEDEMSPGGMERTSSPLKMTGAADKEMEDLRAKIASLEATLQEKDAEMDRMETSRQERDAELSLERDDWQSKHGNLERRMMELQGRADAHEQEMGRTHEGHAKREAGIREELDQTISELQGQVSALNSENTMLKLQGGPAGSEEWQDRCSRLERDLEQQRKITEEVRENATHFLQEMRSLTAQSDAALEKEEKLQARINSLEDEVNDWKSRYAKVKTELRTLKASSIGLPLSNMSGDALASRQHYLSRDGLVDDVHVTQFQMSIDELLQAARQNPNELALDKMKVVISHVQQMTAQGKHEYTGLPSPADSPNPMSPELNGVPPSSATLKARVARNATGLITATRNYVSSDGLSPVSLVDAASANLTAAVIDYVKTVGIKATSSNDLSNDSSMDDDYEHAMGAASKSRAADITTGPSPNGWFSRLKGSFDSSYSNDIHTSLRDDESEYNSYR